RHGLADSDDLALAGGQVWLGDIAGGRGGEAHPGGGFAAEADGPGLQTVGLAVAERFGGRPAAAVLRKLSGHRLVLRIEQSHLGEQTVGDLELHRVRRGNADIAVLDRSDQLGLVEFGYGVTVAGYRAFRHFRRGTPGQHHRQQDDQDHRSENPTDRPAPTTYTHI